MFNHAYCTIVFLAWFGGNGFNPEATDVWWFSQYEFREERLVNNCRWISIFKLNVAQNFLVELFLKSILYVNLGAARLLQIGWHWCRTDNLLRWSEACCADQLQSPSKYDRNDRRFCGAAIHIVVLLPIQAPPVHGKTGNHWKGVLCKHPHVHLSQLKHAHPND